MNNNNIITKRTARRNPFKRNYPLDGIKKSVQDRTPIRHKIEKTPKGNSLEGINAKDAFDKQAYISDVSARKRIKNKIKI